ncbi:hypothetical protein ACH47B_13305 [Rhodococcus sp. NPDC019627]|uniref:hypothetical protein n=1 Tax=unclassified Rhodococcus (in: high G+C Gram-positive bacteria) TaxID=192944 RepID=UPI0033DA5BDB
MVTDHNTFGVITLSTWTVGLDNDDTLTINADHIATNDSAEGVVVAEFWSGQDTQKLEAMVPMYRLRYIQREPEKPKAAAPKVDNTITINTVNVEDVALAFAKFSQRQFVGYTDKAPSILGR